jgi:serine/threonine protein kinase
MSATDLNVDVNGPPPSMTEGARFAGDYVLIRRLDSDVWLAQDEVRGADVSLHFAPVAKDDQALKELRLDVKRSRQLIHPNILRVHDLAEGGEWMAVSMEAFEGESLASQIDRQHGKGGALSTIQSWAVQVARTLEEAHRINVLHRDLTPANIFLTSAGKALVANFGISRALRDARARAGASQPADFASPQLREGKAATRADDIYSFGATLFAAAVGKAPSIADDVSPQAPTGLSAESLAALESAGLPANWQATILACLATDPEARPRSAADLGRRLAEFGCAPGASPRLLRRKNRRRLRHPEPLRRRLNWNRPPLRLRPNRRDHERRTQRCRPCPW